MRQPLWQSDRRVKTLCKLRENVTCVTLRPRRFMAVQIAIDARFGSKKFLDAGLRGPDLYGEREAARCVPTFHQPVELVVRIQIGRYEDPVVNGLSVEVSFGLQYLVRNGAYR
ncbi:hypothetical protein AOZ06_04090 [Kibdelosporangium phytohabitans]|uniref:Uncharacterized protein n=1 Tax=Kibdelosporangium phytohabitans TaxID=860235 RepID=A0A0N9HTH8_9PSEU|nr:hypothetical protein AOZ06_04090 [Kibdelosporangium phytohabitans]